MNKEQLLQYFSTLDVSTLQKLEKYSKLLIIPDEDLLVNVTMSQMVDKAHSLADSLFPEWTDRSKSDFGEFLVELFALFSEKDFWYLNAFANEGILKKMRSYSNAFSKASSLGYYPEVCKGSSASFNVSFSSGEEVTYERGDLIVSVGGLKFTNDSAFTIQKSDFETTKQLILSEGSHVAEDVTFNGFSIFIRKKNIDLDSILVAIDNVTYSRVKNFGLSAPDSTHFMVLPEEDGSCSVFFGSDGFGIKPTIGKTVHVEYRTCNGYSGNTSVAQAEITDSLDSRKATFASMLSDATGGSNPETLTEIKEKAPMYFYTKSAAVNETTAMNILNSFSFVKKSNVTVAGKDVVFRVIPTSGLFEPTENELDYIYKNFLPYLMMGYNGVYAINSYKSLLIAADPLASKIIVDTIILSGYNAESIKEEIIQILKDVTNPLVSAEYGGMFNKTSMDILIRSRVSGVQSTTFKILVNGDEQIMPDISLEKNEIFRMIDPNEITVRTNVI